MRCMLCMLCMLCMICMLGLTGCRTPGQADPKAPAGSVESLAGMMVGSYTSDAQAKTDPDFKVIELHMAPIWSSRKDGPWLYIEQAAAGSLDKPYRQRVYHLSVSQNPEKSPGTVESVVFELPGDPLTMAGAWQDPKRFDTMVPEALQAREGCTVYVVPNADGTWTGSTDGELCRSTLRGATYATSEVTITATELRSWDRGFDKDGKQVWGAVKGAYRFVKKTPAAPTADPDRAKPMGT